MGPEDILWVKNVKASKGAQYWSYQDEPDFFILNWSSEYTRNFDQIHKPQPGQIILLFQSPSFRSGPIHFTHLVTPVDNKLEDEFEQKPLHRWGRNVRTIAKADPFDSIPKPNAFNFRSVGNYHSFSVDLIRTKLTTPQIKELIWDLFMDHLLPEVEGDIDTSLGSEERTQIEALEGTEKRVYRSHLIRERNWSIITARKQNSLRENNGLLPCECCGFEFIDRYGPIGTGFIEGHHKIPIHKGERITKEEDIALVCANCHRMLHRKLENGNYLSTQDLKTMLTQHNKNFF